MLLGIELQSSSPVQLEVAVGSVQVTTAPAAPLTVVTVTSGGQENSISGSSTGLIGG